jgi:hypothetical protein
MDKKDVTDEYINYIILLSAMQVVYNSSFELKDSKFYSGKVKVKVKEAINALTQQFGKDHKSIWRMDEKIAADFMHGIQSIGEHMAKSNGTALPLIASLLRNDINLTEYKLVKIDGSELRSS